VLAEVTSREIGPGTIAEALELTAPVTRRQPHRYDRFAVGGSVSTSRNTRRRPSMMLAGSSRICDR